MGNPTIEVADIFRSFWSAYKATCNKTILPSHQKAAMDIMACMTEDMGGKHHRCNDCNETFWAYHGCRNRACPKCHGRQMVEWLKKRSVELLPCKYFHVVITVPSELRSLFFLNQKDLYGILMRTAAHAVIEISKERKYLGAVPGILSVMHTWTTRMQYHPHVHMLVTGGGLEEDGKSWRETASSFLLPQKKLSLLFRKRFRENLEKERPDLFTQAPKKTWKKEWCSFIDCKDSNKGQDAVLNYLARYVFRSAINNSRILKMDETNVSFKYKDNTTGEWETETISGIEFIRRFLLHVLPKGLHKVRYFGLWCPTKRARLRSLAIALQLLLSTPILTMKDMAEKAIKISDQEDHGYVPICPHCGSKNVSNIGERRRRWRRYVI